MSVVTLFPLYLSFSILLSVSTTATSLFLPPASSSLEWYTDHTRHKTQSWWGQTQYLEQSTITIVPTMPQQFKVVTVVMFPPNSDKPGMYVHGHKAVVSKFLVFQARPHQIEEKTQLF